MGSGHDPGTDSTTDAVAAPASDVAAEDAAVARSEEFVRLFATHDRRIFAFILALVRDAVAAEDIFGETSVVLWREFPKFRAGADFAPWAFGIAFNQVRKYRRQRKNDRHLFCDELLADLAGQATRLSELQAERRAALAHCVKQLNGRNRELLDLFYRRRQGAGEIAQHWGRSVHAVYKALKTVRRALFDCVTQRLTGG